MTITQNLDGNEAIPTPETPLPLFRQWLEEAWRSEPADANAMTVATVSAVGAPSVRILLLKGADERGFVFFTNLESRKGLELLGNPRTALCFHWKTLGRQVRVEGVAERVDDAEADAYFATRPRGSQIGAWASAQSRPLEDRATLARRFEEVERQFEDAEVPRPPHWSGFRVVPQRIEFWLGRESRLHDRLLYERREGGWVSHRLCP